MDDCDTLMRRVAGGDRAALATIFDLEAGRLIAIAKRIVRRRELAEEVVQEAFVTIWHKAALFDHERGAARAWMTTIVRHRALNILRDGSRLDFHDADQLAALGDRAAEAESAYADLPETEDLKRCLGLLEPQRRRSIVMAYVVGFSHGEIAAHLGAPVGTVKAWIRRGVSALKECLS
ncbi:sigma-70 family RNA polymerase sigma factor [Mesorhizobium sp. YIM 152430]|nr:sigma-70 family RNA polymerase sigma factor [Mesorhizobium sp. YIM 152430]MDF1598730.1 sigma-70 family RNA polymerase sigma factor [Mesorhizobium sp. YIM 152430]